MWDKMWGIVLNCENFDNFDIEVFEGTGGLFTTS